MRRTYNRERYLDRVAQIREHVPDCALTTDIIVGFPGETEEDFAETLEVVEEVGYDGAFTFVFSPRRVPRLPTMPDQIPHPVKRERMERLVALVQQRPASARQRFVGRTMEVLVEGPSRTDPTRLRGRTATTRPSTSTDRRPGRAGRGGDRRRHVHDARRPRAAPEQSREAPDGRLARPDGPMRVCADPNLGCKETHA